MGSDGLLFVGELLIASMFLISGTMKIVDRNGTLELIRAYKFPIVFPSFLAALTIEFGCGICLLLGLLVPFAAGLLAFYTAVATLMVPVRDLFKADSRNKGIQLIGSNAAIVGALLLLIGEK